MDHHIKSPPLPDHPCLFPAALVHSRLDPYRPLLVLPLRRVMHPATSPALSPSTAAAASAHHSPVQPFIGFVDTTTDALRLIMAARQGVIPRITRRLNDAERRSMIRSGTVFVFSVEESGIRRWTEGLSWSPSRIVGNFLVSQSCQYLASRGPDAIHNDYARLRMSVLTFDRSRP